MAEAEIRVGLIGAGGNVRNRHIPCFQKVEGLEIVGVANRTLESSRSVADQFNISQIYSGWQELLEDDSLNAVCIGTWPYMHRTLTLAALEKGKHVLTEARMASTAQEARDMLAASRAHPDLVCQLTPTSTTYKIDNLLKRLIAEGYLGEVLSVEVQALQNRFAETGGDLHWRHDWNMSGYNTLNIGASYESMMRWLGRGNRVMAMSKVHVPYRRDERGEMVSVSIPDHVNILYELANGAQVHMRMSATTGLSTGAQIWLYGTEGTIHIDQQQNVFAGHRGDTQLTEVANPPEDQAYYRVEEQFANAIRGKE
jgi:predicted dehydrogenase